jgi:type I restriction-modification system DNA methylase subunit
MESGEREEITAAAIARLAGVGRSAVANWRRRYPDFPKPAGGSPTSPTFDREAVEAWLKDTGKAEQLATDGQTDTGTQRVAAAPERSVSDLRAGDLLGRVMAALLPRETADGGTADDDMVSGQEGLPVVVDPACGVGTALLAVADRFGDRVRLAGQELDPGLAKAALLRLSGDVSGAVYEIHVGDSLLDDQLAPYRRRAAAVVCEPPFGSPAWPETQLTTDPRWEFGIPASRDGELAWVQHCYAHLRPRGVAVVAVSRRTCVQPSGHDIRAALVRSGALRAVIELPPKMSTAGDTDACLWVLRRPPGKPDPGPVRMVDLSGLGDPADVPREFAAWQRLLGDGDRGPADPAVSRSVPRLELLGGGANLLPSRYVADSAPVSVGDLARVTERLARVYSQAGQGFPVFTGPARAARTAYVTLAELERTGALTIRPRDTTQRAGDVVLRTMGRPPAVVTATVDADGRESVADVGGAAQVIEVDASRLDAYFVAVFLRGEVAALPVANTLSAVSREDLRRCRIPRVPLAEQRRYGTEFRRLLELERALRALADLSGKVIEQAIHGLTTGALAPGRTITDGATTVGERETSER